MKARKISAITGLVLVSGLLVSCSSSITTHYLDERGDYSGKATVKTLTEEKKKLTKSEQKHATGTVKNGKTTIYYATLCPEAPSEIPCYKHKITSGEYQKLVEGSVIQLEKGNLVKEK